MFGIDSSELAVIALVALLVIGPKDLPRVMRMVGQWMAKGRAMTRHLRTGFDTMMREAELEEMQKQWAAQNEAIMKATAMPDLGIRQALPDLSAPVLPAPVLPEDDWMSPADATPAPPPGPPPEPPVAEQPPQPPIAQHPARPRKRPRAAGDAGVAAAAETPKPAKKPRARAATDT